MPQNTGPVLVGVSPDQPGAVLDRAVLLAQRIGVPLVCVEAAIDPALLGSATGVGGSASIDVTALSLDDAERAAAGVAVRERVAAALQGLDLQWSAQFLAGTPSEVLAAVAAEVDASLIVVGTRRPGVGPALQELLAGSVAEHLAHAQDRPVVVVPLRGAHHDRDGDATTDDLEESS